VTGSILARLMTIAMRRNARRQETRLERILESRSAEAARVTLSATNRIRRPQ